MVEEPAETPRRMFGWRTMVIAGAGVVGLGVLVALSQPEPDAPRFAVAEHDATTTLTSTDPLRTELIRCRSLPADSDDGACRAAWEASRRRFFGEPHPHYAPIPVLPRVVTDSAPASNPATPER